MAEPSVIPLRSDLPFQAGTREAILGWWLAAAAAAGLEIRRPEQVQEVKKEQDLFTVRTDNGTFRN